MLGHLHKDFLDDAETVTVGGVDHEKDPINVGVKETPVFTVATLATHVKDHARLVVKGQSHFLDVDIWRCRVILVGVLGDCFETLD